MNSVELASKIANLIGFDSELESKFEMIISQYNSKSIEIVLIEILNLLKDVETVNLDCLPIFEKCYEMDIKTFIDIFEMRDEIINDYINDLNKEDLSRLLTNQSLNQFKIKYVLDMVEDWTNSFKTDLTRIKEQLKKFGWYRMMLSQIRLINPFCWHVNDLWQDMAEALIFNDIDEEQLKLTEIIYKNDFLEALENPKEYLKLIMFDDYETAEPEEKELLEDKNEIPILLEEELLNKIPVIYEKQHNLKFEFEKIIKMIN